MPPLLIEAINNEPFNTHIPHTLEERRNKISGDISTVLRKVSRKLTKTHSAVIPSAFA